MRVKENGQYISNSRGVFVKAKQLLYSLPAAQSITLGRRVLGKGSRSYHYLSAHRCCKTAELLVVVHSANIDLPCELYKYRWQIETMFRAFKTSGFNMEDTHITDPLRLETLLSIMAISFTVAYDIGDEYEKKYPQKIKKHGYKQKSTFKIGMDLIINWLVNCKNKLVQELERIMIKVGDYWVDEIVGVKNVV